ncbi:Hpt domain-containing protein [Vibrio methylphosphonaticus]|uniref:Hpt domain-containing protein n=1 Tax=Vibrio methylphosphonaticus TaxID=2946866 RepID=UPI00202A8862|nr:Hpt domain-containing protein [Vibrio methylphosphonaticus]MCL9774603.1 Hpt domain-containing protein [Vibrio methylphosphonaticus]
MLNYRKSLFRCTIFTILAWAVIVATVLQGSFKEEQATKLVDEISISIDKLRQVLFISQPYRAKVTQQIELDLQLIHAQTMQLKGVVQSGMSTDLTHTVYLLERFVEQAQQLSHDETRLQQFVHNISVGLPNLTASGQVLSNELSSIVLETLFNDSLEARQVYLKLESIQRAAYQLPPQDKQALLLLNSQASVLLGKTANTAFLLDRVVNHPVLAELAKQRQQSEMYLGRQLVNLSIVSLAALFILAVISARMVRVKKRDLLSMRLSRQKTSEPHLQAKVTKTLSTDNVEPKGSSCRTENAFEIEQAPSRDVDNEQAVEDVLDVVKNPRMPSKKPTSSKDIGGVPIINFDTMLSTLDGDKESVLMLLEVFINEHRDDVERLQNLLEQDIQSATRIAHTLKGVSGSIYAEALHQVSTEVEKKLKQVEVVPSELIETLREKLSSAVESAEAYIKREQS